MKPSRKIPPTYACRYRSSDFSPPSEAAGVPGSSPPGNVIPSRSVKTTAGVIFTCICGVDVKGIMLFVNGIPKKIKCCNCGCLHEPEEPLVVANFGTDCKHLVRTYDCENHESTCHACHQVIPGTLKLVQEGEP